MRRLGLAVVLLVGFAAAAEAQLLRIITGPSDLAWDQVASLATANSYGYEAWIDGVNTADLITTCVADTGTDGHDCTAPVPALTQGVHTIFLTAWVFASDGSRVRSTQSDTIHVELVLVPMAPGNFRTKVRTP